MSETLFPVTDLIRRKYQTILTISSLALCVGLTIYVLLLSEDLGIRITKIMVEGRLTSGFSIVFSNFLVFIGILLIITTIVVFSFMIFVAISRRKNDIGLMKAAGCPNNMIFGFFMTELIIISLCGCTLGVILGILAKQLSFFITAFFGNQILKGQINYWLPFLTFIFFFTLALILGAKPILDVTKIKPSTTISNYHKFGWTNNPASNIVQGSRFSIRIALRSLFRRKSATIRIIICLTTVFTLVTISVAGGIIADQTTKSWVSAAIGEDIILLGNTETIKQYETLLSSFYKGTEQSDYDYLDDENFLNEKLLNDLAEVPGVITLEKRLILNARVTEVPGEIFDLETATIISVGDSRKADSLVVGVEPNKVLNKWFIEGRFIKENKSEAVIGDSLANTIFSFPLNQSIMISGNVFSVTGICIDPINNGNVTFIPLKYLQDAVGKQESNVVLLRINPASHAETLSQVERLLVNENSRFAILDLGEVLRRNLLFLDQIWSTIRFLPLLIIVAACFCLIGYFVLSIEEQGKEFGIMRAIGMRNNKIIIIILEQSLIILLSSFVLGVSVGILVTVMILVPQPVITGYTILEISGWLLASSFILLISSLYPALRFTRKPIFVTIGET
jgi:ABC-type antimicrobial peptide transport system permease subunit